VILIGIGANLPSAHGAPRATCEAALAELARRGVAVLRVSRWYETAPVPASDQPWFVNAVAEVETALAPQALLAVLHEVERLFGRERTVPNAARTLDLDLIAYHDRVIDDPGLRVPHPRLAERVFVLLPLADIAPGWRHPVTGVRVAELIARLPEGQDIRPIAP
jgi:2-amino-4-hydroxy-6-hydroxymethyldihydropteridine diphosphokinase